MNLYPLQLEALVRDRRETLMREAEMQRVADELRLAASRAERQSPRSQRSSLAIVWPPLTSHAS
jgi:hypothetical protein